VEQFDDERLNGGRRRLPTWAKPLEISEGSR
jgi:hypothetical protein